MLSLFLLVLTLQDQAVISKEPLPASPWTQIVEAECPERQHIRIEGYGARYPMDSPAAVVLDGEIATDPNLKPFLLDLSQRGAVYRFQMLCEMGGITVRMTYAEEMPDGLIQYRGSMAFFENGRFLSYTGLELLNEESFWFR